jgi:hypothetical protein
MLRQRQPLRLRCAAPLLARQLEVCREQVEWARTEKRTFLRQRIEARLANLYLGGRDYAAALALISRLLSEVGGHSSCCCLCMAAGPLLLGLVACEGCSQGTAP